MERGPTEFVLFTAAGVPVHLSWKAALVWAGLLLLGLGNPGLMLVAFSWFAIMLGHEFAHALTARRLGFRPLWIRLELVHGRCTYEAMDLTEYEAALIAMAGPAAQLLIAVPATVLLVVFETSLPGLLMVAMALFGPFNLAVALMNLTPIREVDGGLAWKVFPLWWRHGRGRGPGGRRK